MLKARMIALLVKLKLKKLPVPTLETRLSVAQYHFAAATNMFQQAHQRLDGANDELTQIAVEADAVASVHLKMVADAKAQISSNTRVMTKLQDFLP